VTETLSHPLQAALDDLQHYLQDEVSPQTAAFSVATLIAHPPEKLMQRVADWAAETSRIHAIPIPQLLLHGLKKVYILGELNLLDREAVANFLDRATTIAVSICPAEHRDRLRRDLTEMRSSGDTTTARIDAPPVVAVRLPTFSGGSMVPGEDAQNARRYSLILDRLTRQASNDVVGAQPAQPDPQAFAQLLSLAATRAQSGQQFNDYLEQLRPLTRGNEGNIFVILGGAMPSWELPNLAPGTSPPPSHIGAMERIMDLAADPVAAMKRFRELVTAAVTKFNDGSLAAAVWMLDVAADSITEKKLDPAGVDRVRAEAVDAISPVQLRKYTENKTRHAALKFALGFFPALHLETLFRSLRGEPRAERRRLLLGFIEAYGTAGRRAALEELEREVARPDADTYYHRNLIYILHRNPCEADDLDGRELDLLTKSTARGQNIYVVKEAATALAQIRTDASVKLLTMRLAEFETILLRNDVSLYPADEVQKLLDRIVAALARIGTSAALLTIARHGMKESPPLGDTRARLAALAQHDLSFDEPTVNVLLKALRDEMPSKFLGRLPKKQDAAVRLIEALSCTHAIPVEEALRDIAQRFPSQDVGRAAAQVLEKWSPVKAPARSEPAATFAGELEFFGLPSVMQSLAEMRATGMLTLSTKQRQPSSKLVFVDGKFLNAQTGHIRGVDALYEALERPIAGSFAFVPYPPERMQSDLTPQEIMGPLLEGVRRHDELQRIAALVPGELTLTKTTVKPTAHAEEKDPGLVRDVWLKACSGGPVAEWERQVPTDGYRVRRLVAHWLEEGALVAVTN